MEELSQADNGTCMEVIHQNSDELYSSSLLVLGTEFKRVYIIDTSLFKVLETVISTHGPNLTNRLSNFETTTRQCLPSLSSALFIWGRHIPQSAQIEETLPVLCSLVLLGLVCDLRLSRPLFGHIQMHAIRITRCFWLGNTSAT